MKKWFRWTHSCRNAQIMVLFLIACLTVSGVSAFAEEEILTEYEFFSEEVPEMPDTSEIPETAEEFADSVIQAEGEVLSGDFLPEDELIIEDDEEITAGPGESEADTEPETETDTEFETDREFETDTEIEPAAETETEDLLIEDQEENGTEESAELASGEYNLTIKGVKVTDSNRSDPTGDGSFYFDGKKTLTICKSGTYTYSGYLIKNEIDGLIIEIPNNIAATLQSSGSTAVYTAKSLTIEGQGTLALVSGGSNSCSLYMKEGVLTITDAEINASGAWGITASSLSLGYNSKLVINRARLAVTSTKGAICDFSKGITINGSYIKAPTYAKIGATAIVGTDDKNVLEATIEKNKGYSVWIGDKQVTDLNKNDILGDGGKAKYDPATNTLTFNNPSISTAHIYNVWKGYYYRSAIYSKGLNLNIKGTLSLSSTADQLIYTENGELNLNANLTLTQLDNPGGAEHASVIEATYALYIRGGTVSLSSKRGKFGLYSTYTDISAGKLTLSNCDLYCSNFSMAGGEIQASDSRIEGHDNVMISNAKITGSGETELYARFGMTITASTISLPGKGNVCCVNDLSISDSKITVVSSKYGVGALNSETGSIEITDSIVSARGFGGIYGEKAVIIEDSIVEAVADNAVGIYSSDTLYFKGDRTKVTAEGSTCALLSLNWLVPYDPLGIIEPTGGWVHSALGGRTVIFGGQVAQKVVISAKPADYSKVDEALGKIPADLSIYTEETVKKVNDAKAAVKRGYNISQQDQVDAMAKAIEDAVKGLVKKQQKVKLVAAYNGAHGIGVKWIKLAGASEYTIWKKYKGVWKSIKTVKQNDSSLQNNGNTLMYTDQTVKTGYGKGYIYSVSAKIGNTKVDYDKAGVAIYRLKPPTLTKITVPKAGTLKVTWKGVFGKTETNGAYDLQYATEADAKAGKFKSVKKLPGFKHNVTSATITGLKKGSKYVFRIRCSKTNKDRGTFYSEYSPWMSKTMNK